VAELAGLRVAVASSGDPSDPAGYSGGPAALLGGLRNLGVDAPALAGTPPAEAWLMRAAILARVRPADRRDLRGAVARERAGAQLGRPVTLARERRLARALRGAGPLDGVVQHGSEYRLPHGTRYVTFEDATSKLARRSFAWAHHEGTRPADHRRHDARAADVYARAVACCTMSHWAAASLVEDFGVPPEKALVVGLGAIRRLEPPAHRDWTVPRFLFVGFAWERKNGPRVLRAFARLREEQPEATLDVVGGHPRLDAPGVTGHGSIALDDPDGETRLAALFERATCFVMPSRHEPAGQVFVEAGSAGIPSIGSTDGGAATTIGPGGLVVDPDDDAAILDAMRRLGAGAAAREAGERARAHAGLQTWELVAERVVRALALPGVDQSGLAAFL
jgi:glycosyltransferase involved in cell wall biosynthesis